MVQVVRNNRLCLTGNHVVAIVAIIAGSILLLIPSIRALLLTILLCISVLGGVVYVAVYGRNLGSQVFALILLVVMGYFLYAAINTTHPEVYLERVWSWLPYLAAVGLGIVGISVWGHSRRQRVYIPYPPQTQPGQLQIGNTQ